MAGRQGNLEVEAIDPDPRGTLQAALALGAQDQGEFVQRDTYFHAVQGCLKLREAPPHPAELIASARAELAGPKVSLYRVAASPGGLEVERDRVEELRAALGIGDERLVPVGYADLLTRRRRIA